MTTPKQLAGRVVRRVLRRITDHEFSSSGVLAAARRRALETQAAADARTAAPSEARRGSRLCTYEDLRHPSYAQFCHELGLAPIAHRKQWEYHFIAAELAARGLLTNHRRGLGFGVGQEPLPAFFARCGVEVVATDQPADAASARAWHRSGQYASGADRLANNGICDPDLFAARASFRPIDMNAVPSDLVDFDFVWSACALEHLGSIDAGLDFVVRSIACLRPGGVAVHTTEFNLSSNDDTVETPHLVAYRRRDIDRLAARLEAQGCAVEIDFDAGAQPLDAYVDLPPYGDEPHLRLMLERYACTSLGLVIERPA